MGHQVVRVVQLLSVHLQTFDVVVFRYREVSEEACLGPFQKLQSSEEPGSMEGSVGPCLVLPHPDTSRPRCCQLHRTAGSLESVLMHAFGLLPEVVKFSSGAALLLVVLVSPFLAVTVVLDLHMALDQSQVADLMIRFPFQLLLELACPVLVGSSC